MESHHSMLMAEYDMRLVTLAIVPNIKSGDFISGSISAASEAILQVYFKSAGT